MTNAQCNDLLEIVEDRYGQSSTIVVSQFPVDKWHGLMDNPTTADAILDRLVLQGESMRKSQRQREADNVIAPLERAVKYNNGHQRRISQPRRLGALQRATESG